jgi:hypothetical protein
MAYDDIYLPVMSPKEASWIVTSLQMTSEMWDTESKSRKYTGPSFKDTRKQLRDMRDNYKDLAERIFNHNA